MTTKPAKARTPVVLDQKLTITKRIGQGRLSVVYAAVHQVLARRFAVKVLSPLLTESELQRRRLRHAVREASSVDYPQAVPLVDYGELQDGRTYLTMPFVRGIQLSKVLARDGRFKIKRAIPILAQLADILEASHGWRVVHGDVKPNNIMLVEGSDARESVRLHDFCISSTLAGPAKDEEDLINLLRVYGNADYLAPEQLSGHSVDGRADIYAFGCLAYRMLVGEPPFVGSNEEVVNAHRRREPVSLLRRSGGEHIGAELDRIVLGCLEKNPSDRYQSMSAVALLLRRLMPALETLDPEEAITGRWNIPEEETEQEEPLPESPSRLRALFYDTILELSEHIADQGKAPDGMLEVTGNIKRVRDEVSSVGARVELTENRFEDIRREQRERESALRYAIIDLTLARNDMDEKTADKRRWDDLQFQLKQLESNLSVLEQQRGERFTLLNTELGQQRDLQRSLEHELVAHYRRLYNEVDALRGLASDDEARRLYRALDRCRAAIAKGQPRPSAAPGPAAR